MKLSCIVLPNLLRRVRLISFASNRRFYFSPVCIDTFNSFWSWNSPFNFFSHLLFVNVVSIPICYYYNSQFVKVFSFHLGFLHLFSSFFREKGENFWGIAKDLTCGYCSLNFLVTAALELNIGWKCDLANNSPSSPPSNNTL